MMVQRNSPKYGKELMHRKYWVRFGWQTLSIFSYQYLVHMDFTALWNLTVFHLKNTILLAFSLNLSGKYRGKRPVECANRTAAEVSD